jgi:hypothetical protein
MVSNTGMVAIYYGQRSGQMVQVLLTGMYSEFLPKHVRRECLIRFIRYVDVRDALAFS